MARTKIQFDTINYQWPRYRGHDINTDESFAYRVAAQNQRYHNKSMAATRAWADALCRKHPAQNATRTYAP